MRIILKTSYLSILDLPETELPPFTLITGINGAGKTHLLKAVETGCATVDIAPNIRTDLRFFDSNRLIPNDTGEFDGHKLLSARKQAWNSLKDSQINHSKQLADFARQLGLPSSIYSDPERIALLSREEFNESIGDDLEVSKKWDSFSVKRSRLEAKSFGAIGLDTNTRQNIEEACRTRGASPLSLDQETFFSTLPIAWGKADIFQQSFAQLFVTYRDLYIENQLTRLAYEEDPSTPPPLTAEEFVRHYNIPPWDFVNATLEEAGLGFRINQPVTYRPIPFDPRLQKIGSKAEIRFSDLSSGEKVIISFALCLYYANDSRQITTYPKLLLLDEIDASLHPSMCRMLVKTIEDTLIGKHGIHVIMTTHSPSTVAVAPEDAIHIMQPGRPGVHKVSRGAALNYLTQDVPTLSINFSGRRQVFVESENDAKIYDRIYQVLRPAIESERSLTFISVGRRSPSGQDINTGCTQVRRIVEELSNAGNESVLGLIDWDGANTSTSRVLVLAENRRDGIENCIFDPLALVAILLREIPRDRCQLKFKSDETYTSLAATPTDRLQELVNEVQELVLAEPEKKDSVICHYYGGFDLTLNRDFLMMDDHALEAAVLATFPQLRKIGNNPGDLQRRIVEKVFFEHPSFVPRELFDTFHQLLSIEIISES